MRRLALGLGLLLLAPAFVLPAAEEANWGPGPPESLECLPAPSEGEAEVLRLWTRRGTALQAGSNEEAGAVLDQIRSEMQLHRIERLPHLATALLAESEQLRESKNFGRARLTAEEAVALDPGSATARFQLARLRWRSGHGLVQGLRAWLGGARLSLAGFWRSYAVLGNLAVIVSLTLTGLGAVLSLVLLIRHGPAFVHDVMERLPRRWSEKGRRLAGRVLLFLPLALFFGGAWVLLWWPAVLARHASRSERVLIVALLLMVVLSGPALEAFERYLAVGVSPTARMLAASDASRTDGATFAEIRRLTSENPDVAAYHFLLGNLFAVEAAGREMSAEGAGCFGLAEIEYLTAIRLEPREARYRINLGNLYFRNGSYREAWARYLEALEIDSASILARYNLGTAYGRDVNRLFDKEQVLAEARAKDEERLRALLEQGKGTEVVDARLGLVEMSWRILAEAMGQAAAERGVWSGLGRGTSVAGLLAAGLALVAFLVVGSDPARRCERCGVAFCFRCKSEQEAEELCSACLNMTSNREGVTTTMRELKTREIDRFIRRERIGLGLARLAAPGVDRMARGRTLIGALAVFVWLAGWIWLLVGGRLLVPMDLPVAGLGRPGTWPLMALMGLVWIVFNRPRRRHRTRRAGSR